ncbi:cytochrome P450 monooxygenase apf7 [Apiospora phragmitis]|uniref:Cytochrome P450 monooxygenase apf7 n=1 Tax=Apiospora phragmitis TaxID=2905665 RepID=A0ABR1VC49_9PEZI
MTSSAVTRSGSDTTATAISTTLLLPPPKPRRVRAAAARGPPLFTAVEDPRRRPRLAACRWLRACIDEAMRMSPSVSGLLPCQVRAPLSVDIAGRAFPPGTDLGVAHYAIHHNEELYPDSFAYLPAALAARAGGGGWRDGRGGRSAGRAGAEWVLPVQHRAEGVRG